MPYEENVAAAQPEVEVVNTPAVDNYVSNEDKSIEVVVAEPTLFEKVVADEQGDAVKFAELELRISTLEATLSAAQSWAAGLAERLNNLEAAAPAATNTKLEALVAKMYEKMKLLIAMD